MAEEQREIKLPVWVLKWTMPPNSRGRKHAGIFVANSGAISNHPVESPTCPGTFYHVVGSPFGGFGLNIRRNWDSTLEPSIGTAQEVGSIDQKHVWVPDIDDFVEDDTRRRGETDRCALNIRTPGVTSRPWIAEEVMDCQDWLVSFIEHLVQRGMLGPESLAVTQQLMDQKTALMPVPGGASAQTSIGADTPVARPFTASTVQLFRPVPQESAQAVSSATSVQTASSQPSTKPQVGASEWKIERARFERYNHATSKWEYFDPKQRIWLAD